MKDLNYYKRKCFITRKSIRVFARLKIIEPGSIVRKSRFKTFHSRNQSISMNGFINRSIRATTKP